MKANPVTWCLITMLGSMAWCATAAPQLELDTVAGAPGQTIELPLRLTGATAAYAGFNTTIYLPEGVQFDRVTRGTALPSNDVYLAARPLSDPTVNGVVLLGYSATQTFSSDGVLCVLHIRIGTEVLPGTYPLIIDAPDRATLVRGSHALSSADGVQSITHTVQDGALELAFGDALTMRGTPHWWLSAHNLTAGGWSFEEADLYDHDDDGFSAWQEYIADTDPTNNASFLHVYAIEEGPPVIAHFEPASTARVYRLQVSEDLAGDTWFTVDGPRPGVGGTDHLTDAQPPSSGATYRIDVRIP